jgi:hypothetical protein
MTSALSEADARTICTQVTGHLSKMGANVQAIGVNLNEEGFWFSAVINGEQVWVRRGEGNWEYQNVAADLYASALEHRLAQFEELSNDRQPLTATPTAQGSHGERES